MNANKTHRFAVHTGRYIQEYCRSIHGKGIVKFHHDITFGHDEVSMLMADPEIYEFYLSHQAPLACTDASGRILDNGIYVNSILEAKYPESQALLKMIRRVAQHARLNYGTCSLHYAKNDQHCQHLYSLFFDLNTNDFMHFVINNGAFIQDLIDSYQLASEDIVLEASDPENRVTLPNSQDYFSSRGYPITNDINKSLRVIHRITGLPMHLSQQRGLCLSYFVSGHPIKKIAAAMQLSPKTIEHYLEILRKELGCRTSKELIFYYAHQIR